MMKIDDLKTRGKKVEAFYTMGTVVTLKGALRLEDDKVIDIYVETDKLEKGENDLVVGDVIVQSLDQYLDCFWNNDEHVCQGLRKNFKGAARLENIDLVENKQLDLHSHLEGDRYYAYVGDNLVTNDLLIDLGSELVAGEFNLEAR